MAQVGPTIVVALNSATKDFSIMLRNHGFRVLPARSGIEVVSHIFPRVNSYAEPTLLVLSSILPGYNGLSVLAGVRSLGWRTPMLMTWSSQAEWMADEAIRLGVSALLAEPVNLDELAAETIRLLGPLVSCAEDRV